MVVNSCKVGGPVECELDISSCWLAMSHCIWNKYDCFKCHAVYSVVIYHSLMFVAYTHWHTQLRIRLDTYVPRFDACEQAWERVREITRERMTIDDFSSNKCTHSEYTPKEYQIKYCFGWILIITLDDQEVFLE